MKWPTSAFASVYREFQDLDGFREEIDRLEKDPSWFFVQKKLPKPDC